jgi:ubiquinone/menaquinone biosynthesis C-methylase UbiE
MIALLQDRYHPARLVGTDYDPAQVSAAREFLTDRWGEIPPSVELRSADALALPFPDSSFDFVFAMMMLHHVEVSFREYVRRPQALAEIRRVSAPSGRLIYSDMFRREEIRGTLAELGFQQQFLRAGWRSDLAVYRAPSQPTVGERTGQPVASA